MRDAPPLRGNVDRRHDFAAKVRPQPTTYWVNFGGCGGVCSQTSGPESFGCHLCAGLSPLSPQWFFDGLRQNVEKFGANKARAIEKLLPVALDLLAVTSRLTSSGGRDGRRNYVMMETTSSSSPCHVACYFGWRTRIIVLGH